MKHPFLSCLCAVLFVTVAMQSIAYLRLREVVSELRQERPAFLGPFPILKGINLLQQPVSYALNNGHAKTLVLSYSTGCPHCQKNWPAWKRLVQIAEQRGVLVYYIDLRPGPASRSYCGRFQIPEERVLAVDYETTVLHRLDSAPSTELFDESGQLLTQVVGELNHKMLARLVFTVNRKETK